MTSPDPPDQTPDQTMDEVTALKQEIARLRAATEVTRPPRRQAWRPVVVGLLVLLAAFVAPLSVLSTWASGQISDTDRYIATVAPLASDPDVQDAVADRVEQVIFTYLDLDEATERLVSALDTTALPPRAAETLSALATPLASAVQGFVRARIDELVASDAFEVAWLEANRTAHSELVGALTGQGGGSVEIDRGTVRLDLAVLIDTVKGQLSDAGFGIVDRIPEVNASFALVQSDDLSRVQSLLGLLKSLSTWLPVLGIGLVVAAVLLSRDRRRTVLASGLAVAVSMLLLGAVLNVVRPFYLDALPASSSVAAAGAIYDQLVGFIRVALRGVVVVALTVALVAWFSASHGPGAAARQSLVNGIGALRRGSNRAGLRTGRLGVALAQYRGPLRVGVAGVAAVGYLAQDHPTSGTAVTFVLVTGAVLLLLEILADESPTAPAATAAEARASAQP